VSSGRLLALAFTEQQAFALCPPGCAYRWGVGGTIVKAGSTSGF